MIHFRRLTLIFLASVFYDYVSTNGSEKKPPNPEKTRFKNYYQISKMAKSGKARGSKTAKFYPFCTFFSQNLQNVKKRKKQKVQVKKQ